MACSSTNKNISRQDKHSWSFMTLYGVWLYGMNLQKGWASLSKLSIVKPVDACWGGSSWGEAAKISPKAWVLKIPSIRAEQESEQSFARWKQNLGTETGASHPSIRLFAVIPVREQWLAMTCPHLRHTEQPRFQVVFPLMICNEPVPKSVAKYAWFDYLVFSVPFYKVASPTWHATPVSWWHVYVHISMYVYICMCKYLNTCCIYIYMYLT